MSRGNKGRTDYDASENMTISLSDDVEVLPSFDSMGLKEDLLRGIYAYGKDPDKNISSLVFIILSNRLRKTVSHPAACH